MCRLFATILQALAVLLGFTVVFVLFGGTSVSAEGDTCLFGNMAWFHQWGYWVVGVVGGTLALWAWEVGKWMKEPKG